MDDPHIIALLPAIEEQLTSSETPFVRNTLEHLITHDDIDDQEARYMVAFCLADEIEKMTIENRPFDSQRYQMLLSLLPNLPE